MKDLFNRILPLSKKASVNQINLLNQKIYEIQTELSEIKEMLYSQIDQERLAELLKLRYMERTGNILNLDNPQTYNEKIQWLKLYDRDPRKTLLSDKYLVRDWIRNKIGEEYLIPLLGVYRSTREIDFNTLPNSFVLKANHGSGMNAIVKDKSTADMNAIIEKANQWLKTNYAFNEFEMHYNDIPRRLIVEQYMENKDGDLPDYKFWCFDGKCRMIEMIVNRYSDPQTAFYDSDWNRLAFTTGHYPPIDREIEKPAMLQKMIDIAEKLSEGFVHVRVDLYQINSEIKFGEMTFTPFSGIYNWNPSETDLEVGKMLVLPKREDYRFNNE